MLFERNRYRSSLTKLHRMASGADRERAASQVPQSADWLVVHDDPVQEGGW